MTASGKSGPLLEVRNLSVDIPTASGMLRAVRGADIVLRRGETFGMVGESGSGKSMTALAIMGILPPGALVRADKLDFDGRDLLAMSERERARTVCGVRAGMIFQEPNTSLNPVYTVGRQLTETALLHRYGGAAEARERAMFLLERVGLAGAAGRLRQYPHQLSGGQRQRVMIAMALMNSPDLLIADEPTTALDVTVQAQILKLLADLQDEFGMSMILITHDLGVVARVARKVAVMYAGQIVENGAVEDIFRRPRHPYTRGLLDCVPAADAGGDRGRLGAIPGVVPGMIGEIRGCAFAPRCAFAQSRCLETPPMRTESGRSYRCVLESPPAKSLPPVQNGGVADGGEERADEGELLEMRNIHRTFIIRPSLFSAKKTLRAVDGVNLRIGRGEALALVGESGCGKTTLARILIGAQREDGGEVLLRGRPARDLDPRRRARMVQPIFQDPHSSLNPRRTLGEIIGRPLEIVLGTPKAERAREASRAMELVGLPRRLLHSYPGQLSGGQRQRAAIARALILRPELVVCDEPTSALDVSVQAQILNLLLDLKSDLGLSYLVITHDLGVVRYLATRVAVMYLGQIVETGGKEDVFASPRHPYTRALLASVLTPEPGGAIADNKLGHSFPDPMNPPSGCRFHPRCPEGFSDCRVRAPRFLGNDKRGARCLLLEKNEEQTNDPTETPA